MNNIHPIFDNILSKSDKEKLLKQKGIVLWMVGLSGAGKSTIASEIERRLYDLGYLTQLLDGDNLRTGINSNLGFTETDRLENIRRSAETAKLFASCGVITICSFISPTQKIRSSAKKIIGEDVFFELYINASFKVCSERDVKGLYAKAQKGEIKNFTGLDAPFEDPASPWLEINTEQHSLNECCELILENLLPLIAIN